MTSTPPLSRIDGDQARLVADAFLDAPAAPADRLVLAAYADLARQADRWFHHLTAGPGGPAVRVAPTRCPEPYADGEELAARVRTEGVLELRPSRLDRDGGHPLLAPDAYDRVRAVHDLLSHARCGYGFDRHGEFSGWLVEDRCYTGLGRWALAAVLHAEHSVLWTTGRRAEHKAVLLPAEVLRASRRRGRRPPAGDDR